MNTAFSTGPGFFAVCSRDNKNALTRDTTVQPGCARVYVARIEAYDLSGSPVDLETKFTVLPALAENKPSVAKAMLLLLDVLQANRKALEAEARK